MCPFKAKETIDLILKLNRNTVDSAVWLMLEIHGLSFKLIIEHFLLFPENITLSVTPAEIVFPLIVQRQIKPQVGRICYFQRSTLKSEVSVPGEVLDSS